MYTQVNDVSHVCRALFLTICLSACQDASTPDRQLIDPQAPTPLQSVNVSRSRQATSSAAVDGARTTELPAYNRVEGIAGNLSSIGSDTLANLMTLWTEEFKRFYPGVNIQVQAAGSSTAPPALTEGTANFGPMSRPMKSSEVEAFESRYGYKPTAIRVALDALVIYVHKDNPLRTLTISQIDAIYSKTKRCGGALDINQWGQLGLSGSWRDRPVQIYGRNSVSGTYGYFKQVALCSGDFKDQVNEQPGSASVVQAISSSLNGIGYSGIGYITSGVRTVDIFNAQGAPVAATRDNAARGSYPLARYLYLYINKKPGTALSPIEHEFIRMILSKQGQAIVTKDGYIPLSTELAQIELLKVQ